MEVSKCSKIAKFKKTSLKMKNCKTLYEVKTASRLKEVIQSTTPSDKTLLRLWYKSFLTEIYRHFLSKCFTNAAFGRQEMGQCKCFFWHQTETYVLENLLGQNVFWLCCRSILISMLTELRFIKWMKKIRENYEK